MYFKITVSNGDFPLTHECSTASQAFGCIEALSKGLLHDIPIDMDEILVVLARMKSDTLCSISAHRYHIERMEGELAKKEASA